MTQPRGGEPLFLCFDTSGPWIAASVFEDDVPLHVDFVEMKRGQAEAVVPMLDALLLKLSVGYPDLAGIGVGVGPGNFTGIRISVSLARGLALSLGIPAFAVSSFDLMRDPSGPAAEPALLLSVPAPRDQVYVQLQRYGAPDGVTELIDPLDPPEHLGQLNLRVRGAFAEQIASRWDAPFEVCELEDIAYRLGKSISHKWTVDRNPPPPVPLYVRPPDAAPSADPPPVILS
ncbi:MAG: tRNA (adenosine(37)-N6)-threonylcarbamoyltransferase complex dimerization subunit type 1 TsaB [Paracoccaceae bacterium]